MVMEGIKNYELKIKNDFGVRRQSLWFGVSPILPHQFLILHL